jgi:DNA (cytosine-5)-methyltransferase 1
MLASLADLGYVAEWRVVNAAEYGFPQRRRRIFILAYKNGTKPFSQIKNVEKWIYSDGVIAQAFPILKEFKKLQEFSIEGSLDEISESFSAHVKRYYLLRLELKNCLINLLNH